MASVADCMPGSGVGCGCVSIVCDICVKLEMTPSDI